MPKYIDANELDVQISRKQPPLDMRAKEKEGFKAALLSVRSMIHSANGADVQEVRHSKWLYCRNNNYESGLHTAECGNCRITQSVVFFERKPTFNFCPYCGVRMDGEQG